MSLYNEFEAQTIQSYAINDEVRDAIYPIITKWQKLGFSVREIHSIINAEIYGTVAEIIVKATQEKKKKIS